MPQLFAGCTQELGPADPFAAPAGDLMTLARVVHNSYVYHFRQGEFARLRCYQESRGSAKRTILPPSITGKALKGLVRGTHTLDAAGQPVESRPGQTKVVLGMLGSVWDSIDYQFQGLLRSLFALRTAWYASGRVGPEPGLPDYHRSAQRHLTYRADRVKFRADYTLLHFPKGKSPAAIHLPPLPVPAYVQAAMRSGQAKLVEVTLHPRRAGGVRVHWSLKETGRRGAEFPDAPANLAKALLLGPVAAIDLGVGNLLACTLTEFRPVNLNPALSTEPHPVPATTPASSPRLPEPLLVRGLALDEECHRAGLRIDVMKAQLPFPKGGKKGGSTESTTRSSTSSTTATGSTTKGRRQQRSSRRITLAWDKHAARRYHLAHVAAQEVLTYLTRAGARALVLGWNEGIKQELSMGRTQNRRFGVIPYELIRSALRLGCARLGILYVEVEESYTSKTSFYDGELPFKRATYAGTRVQRGLFRTGPGLLVNADVNGSLQILVKALLEEGLEGVVATQLTVKRREEVVRGMLNPRSVQLSRGRKVAPTPRPVTASV